MTTPSEPTELLALIMSLEDAGRGLSDDQYLAIEPDFVMPELITVLIDSEQHSAHLIAKRGRRGLAISEARHWVFCALDNAAPTSSGAVEGSTDAAIERFLSDH